MFIILLIILLLSKMLKSDIKKIYSNYFFFGIFCCDSLLFESNCVKK